METSTPKESVAYHVGAHGIGWIVFDNPDSSVNIFDVPTLEALGLVVARIARDLPTAVVITSAKERNFMAGADLKLLSSLPDATSAEDLSRAGQRLFNRLAALHVPVLCAIHGSCAGGGYELALACDWRIATAHQATRIGLPEIGLGTLPAWGGSTRLPRLIGAGPALAHILEAKLESAETAFKSGMVDELVPCEELRSRAEAAALRLARDGKPLKREMPIPDDAYFSDLKKQIPAGASADQQAREILVDVVWKGTHATVDEALAIEARAFGVITPTDHCRARVRTFFESRASGKGRKPTASL